MFPFPFNYLLVSDDFLSSKRMRIPGVLSSSYCPDFTAHRKAARNPTATTILRAMSRKMTSMMVRQRNLGRDGDLLSAVTVKTDNSQEVRYEPDPAPRLTNEPLSRYRHTELVSVAVSTNRIDPEINSG
jgi:hypothetical protein